jgi:hypothetical protein
LNKLKKIKTAWGPPVSPTIRTKVPGPHRARSDSGGHRFVHPRLHPPFSPTVSVVVPTHRFRRPRPPPRVTFKRSAPSKSSSFLLLLLPPSPCSPRRSPLPLLHPMLRPSSAQAMLLSRSTVLKRRFHLEPAAVKSPRSHPTSCTVSTEVASSTVAIFGHLSPWFSPPRGPHRRPEPLRPASRRRRPRVRTTAAVPLQLTRATADNPLQPTSDRLEPTPSTAPPSTSSPTARIPPVTPTLACHRLFSSTEKLFGEPLPSLRPLNQSVTPSACSPVTLP